jgi:hypothetical protein
MRGGSIRSLHSYLMVLKPNSQLILCVLCETSASSAVKAAFVPSTHSKPSIFKMDEA